MSFGEKLKELRLKHNLNQTDLGEIAGVHYSYIGKYENNQQIPSTETLKKIANYFNVTIDYLLNEDADNVIKTTLKDKDLLEQFKSLESLPDNDKTVIKELINAFLVKNQIQKLVKN